MAWFSVAGKKSAIAGGIEGDAIRQGGDAGYDEKGRKYLGAINKTVQELTKDLPSDANVSVSGSISHSGTSVDITVDIHANHPDLGADTGYTEPDSIGDTDGSRNNHPNADTRDEEKVNASKQGSESDPFATAEPTPPTSRDPVTDPAVPRGQ